jgi:hypothetical protein
MFHRLSTGCGRPAGLGACYTTEPLPRTSRSVGEYGRNDEFHACPVGLAQAGPCASKVHGGGHDEQGHDGEGGGFGVGARPAGAFIIKNGNARWRPVVNVNRLLMTVGAITIVYMIIRGSVEKARLKAAMRNG